VIKRGNMVALADRGAKPAARKASGFAPAVVYFGLVAWVFNGVGAIPLGIAVWSLLFHEMNHFCTSTSQVTGQSTSRFDVGNGFASYASGVTLQL